MQLFSRQLVLFFLFLLTCNGQELANDDPTDLQNQQMRAGGTNGLDFETLYRLLPLLQKASDIIKFLKVTGNDLSVDCAASLDTWFNSLSHGQLWAIQMLDSNAKLSSGMLEGGFAMFGSFDECLRLKVSSQTWNEFAPNYTKTIQGQYCSVILASNSESKESQPVQQNGTAPTAGPMQALKGAAIQFFRYDICLPSACTTGDLNRAFRPALQSLNITPIVRNCQVDNPIILTGPQKAAIAIFSIIGFLLFMGSLMDIGFRILKKYGRNEIAEEYQSKRGIQALLAFSMYSNGLKLIGVSSPADSLHALNGIRFFSMTWVILAHCYHIIIAGILGNMLGIMDLTRNFAVQAILNAFLAVDTFFFLGGFLLGYLTIKELNKGGRLNVKFFAMFYFHRFWRLTPAVVFVMLFVFLWPLIGSGPLWPDHVAGEYPNCYKNWWVTLIYLQNFINIPRMCMSHTWYLANDMQFYIISPIILISLHLNRKVGLAINGLFVAISIIASGIIADVKHTAPTMMINGAYSSQDTTNFMNDVYYKPWCRIGPFSVGIFVGYFIAFKKDYKIPKWVQMVCWCLAIAGNVGALYGTRSWYNGHLPTKAVGYLYLSVHRTIWSIGIGWMTFACVTGNGGIVNRILSWRALSPLARLTYMAYLIHPIVQLTYTGSLRERVIYTHYHQVVLYLGFLVVSYGVAFPLSLAFEAPFIALEKVIFKRQAKETQKKSSVTSRTGLEQELDVNGKERHLSASNPSKMDDP